MFDFLKATKREFDIIFARDLVEHMTKEEVLMLLSLAHTSLKPGESVAMVAVALLATALLVHNRPAAAALIGLLTTPSMGRCFSGMKRLCCTPTWRSIGRHASSLTFTAALRPPN